MLKICNDFKELNISELLCVNRESTRNSMEQHSLSRFQAEDDFVAYVRDCFFAEKTSFYAVLIKDGAYVSALRMECHNDGWLLSGLETAPDKRGQGNASELVKMVLRYVSEKNNLPVYAHIHKENTASLIVHHRCGFTKLHDFGKLLDGTVSNRYCTLVVK